MNEIIQSLYARKSVRAYTDRPVPAEVKRTVLAAAVQAPTAGGQQLYTILDITAQRLKDTLASRERAGLLVLDEMCSAVNTGMVSLERVTEFLDHMPAGLEVVLTGRDPAPELERRADYITEMRKCKHPYDRGVAPRLGVEW